MAFTYPPVADLPQFDPAGVEYGTALTEVVGLVSESGCGGIFRDDTYSVTLITLVAWKVEGGATQRGHLIVLLPVPREQFRFDDFPAYSIHQMTVLLSNDGTRAVAAAEPSGADRESPIELAAIANELKTPVTVTSARFGEIVLDRRRSCFNASADWNGKIIALSLDATTVDELSDLLHTAEALWNSQEEWKRRVNEFAASELLPLKNTSWLDDDEEPLTTEQFVARMTLTSININCEHGFTFWHDDGDLFCGHAIQISGTLSDGLQHADIPG